MNYPSTENLTWYKPSASGDVPSGRFAHSGALLVEGVILFAGGCSATSQFADVLVFKTGLVYITFNLVYSFLLFLLKN